MGDLVPELRGWTFLGKTIDVAHNLGMAGTNWTWEGEWEGESGDGLVAQGRGCSSLQGKTNDTDHNLGVVGANSMGDHRAFGRDTKTVAGTPILGMKGIPVRKSEAQDMTNSEVAVRPTHYSPSRPSSGHTHNMTLVQPVQNTCSVGACKAG